MNEADENKYHSRFEASHHDAMGFADETANEADNSETERPFAWPSYETVSIISACIGVYLMFDGHSDYALPFLVATLVLLFISG